jgi:beta-lactamase class D
MRKIWFVTRVLCCLAVFLPGAVPGRADTRIVERPDWQRFFQAAGVVGTMVLQKDGASDILVYDAKRAARPYLPASTFKILNACIGLETRAVSGPDAIFPYDGKPRRMPAWNTDLTLAQAFAVSCVPVFQEIARRIGFDRMAWYVAASGYGNADISGGIDRFWLDGGLRISALGQVDFLSRLDHHHLPFSAATIEAVRDMMIVEKGLGYTMRAKTGWASSVSPGIGWYVGMVSRDDATWYFALNSDIGKPDQVKARQSIVRAILLEEGILPPI